MYHILSVSLFNDAYQCKDYTDELQSDYELKRTKEELNVGYFKQITQHLARSNQI